MSCSTPLTSAPTAQPQTGEKKALNLTPTAISKVKEIMAQQPRMPAVAHVLLRWGSRQQKQEEKRQRRRERSDSAPEEDGETEAAPPETPSGPPTPERHW